MVDPCTLVLFGASGDLTQRMVMPAMGFRSRQADSFGVKAIAALRNEFGGHAVTPTA